MGHRHGLDLAWLWHGPAATAPIRPLALERPYATGAALKRQKKKNHLLSKRCTIRKIFIRSLILALIVRDRKVLLSMMEDNSDFLLSHVKLLVYSPQTGLCPIYPFDFLLRESEN